MATWYRKEIGTARHRKIIKLSRRLGLTLRDTLGLVTSLWDTVCETAPDGSLENWDAEDIALACLWDGDPSELVDALRDVKLIDRVKAHYEIHNWGRYNERTKATARQRKYRERQAELAASLPGDVTVTSPQRHGDVTVTPTNNTDSTIQDTPQTCEPDGSTLDGSTPKGNPKTNRDDIQEVWQHYRTHHPKSARVLRSGRKEHKLIKQRLEDFGADDLKAAIDGYHRSPWHTGQNDHNRQYLQLELILRDLGHVQAGLEMLEKFNGSAGQPRNLLDYRLDGDDTPN